MAGRPKTPAETPVTSPPSALANMRWNPGGILGGVVNSCSCPNGGAQGHVSTCPQATDVDRLRAALAFYADPSSWDEDSWGVRGIISPPDYGKPGFTARQALGLPEPAEED